MTLQELPLNSVHEFWNNKNVSKLEMLTLLSITGCIPKYLEEIDPKIPSEENIKRLCFTPGGFLVDEFQRIFSDLFLHDSALYRRIIEVISTGSKTMSEIAKQADFSRSGRLSKYLSELELSGFIETDYSWNFSTAKEKKSGLYRLKDNYLRFYIKYIEPNLNKIKKEAYLFQSLSGLVNWKIIMGLQFENLVVSNRTYIKETLGLNHNDVLCDNPYLQRKTNSQEGCQIDYLIQTRFNTLYVCEVKFSTKPIGYDIIPEIQSKIKKLKVPKNTSFRPVLIHVGNVTEEVENSEYFYKIIDFTDFI